MTKCPKCEKIITSVTMNIIDGKDGAKTWRCVSYNCPFCFSSIGVQMDPLAIHNQTVKAIKGR